jgi:hypothetical protein
MDETTKMVMVDWSKPVAEVVDTIGEHLSLSGAEEYSLIKDGAAAGMENLM